MADVTRALASFVAEAPPGVASARATDVIKQATLDLLGVTVLGADEDAGRIALDYASSQASPGPAAVWGGRGERLAPSLAAFVNGTAGHALDYDDIGVGVGHVSVAIMPAVFAIAEQVEADGATFIDALVLGYEVAHRLTTMYSDTRLGPYAAGYHKPSAYAVFGGAAGCARLLGLDVEQTACALGMAASQSGGLRANFGTMTKPMHAGIANRTAIEVALLARAGFTASTTALEQRFGWHDVICRGEGDLDGILDGLGSSYAVEQGLVFKAYPSCGANHYAIDGVINLMRAEGLVSTDVAAIDVTLERRNLEEVLVYPWARTPLEGKFSLAYNVAAAVADGAVTVETFTESAVARLAGERDRVRVHATDDLPQNGARVRIETTDGRVLEHEQLVLRGSVEDPMSWDELEVKFRANVRARIGDAGADVVLEGVRALEHQTTLTKLSDPLVGPHSE